jgi:FAD/FMN-containing dehydrogenase
MATHATHAAPARAALDDLRQRISGKVLTSDDGFAEVRDVFNAMHHARPELVVACADAADVSEAVNFARTHDLPLAVRGGGHSIAGLSAPDGGVLIDLAEMRAVEVDPESRRARVQGGALWSDLDGATQPFGLAAPGGVVSDTGVAGLTLGGGYGWLRRKHGLSSDNLLEAEVVTADGELRRAAPDENPELFWALRGGGGNFGVVTSFAFQLHPVGPEVAFAATFYPIEEAAQVMRGWRDFVEQAPEEVTATCVTITFPANPEMPEAVHDRPVIIVGAVHAGAVEEGMEMLQPLRELGTPLFDMSGPTPFVGVQQGFDPLFPRGQLRAYWKSHYLNELTDAAIDLIAAKAQERPAPLTLVNAFHMGGAIADVGEEDTAFAERSSPYMVSIDGMWTEAADDEAKIEWVRAAWREIGEHANGAVYLNFTGLADEAPDADSDSGYGRNLARLAEVKAEYDPQNLFRQNNNIRPATGTA